MIKELVSYFQINQFTIIGAAEIEGFGPPQLLSNDGYGTQEDQQPDVYAYDAKNERYIIGLVKTSGMDLETPAALTQYDVCFDNKNPRNQKPSGVFVLLPGSCIADFSGMITHYLHPDYWKNLTMLRSETVSGGSSG